MKFANFGAVQSFAFSAILIPRSDGEIEKDITSPRGLMLISAGKTTLKGCKGGGKDGYKGKRIKGTRGLVRSDCARTNRRPTVPSDR